MESNITGTPAFLKYMNQDKVIAFLRVSGTATKPQIAAATGISLVTVTKLVNALLEDGRIAACGIDDSTGGRRAQRFRVNPASGYSIGIYYEKGCFTGIVIDAVGEIVCSEEFPADGKDRETLFAQICRTADCMLENCAGRKAQVIGVGIPGVAAGGSLSSIPSLAAWEGFPLAARLEEHYGIPVLLENDMNLAAMGIYAVRYEENIQDMLLIYLDEGVGAGIILGGSLYCGKTNFAGELGYLPVFLPDKGRGGETGGGARTARGPADPENLEGVVASIRRRLEKGENSPALRERLCGALSQAVLSVVSVLNPEVIVLKSAFLRKEDIRYIREAVERAAGIRNTPDFALLRDMKTCCLFGMVKLCMEYRSYEEKSWREGGADGK